jgi:tRNA nucleotidyltransferase (CCA-adding enzyme)
MVRKGLMTNTPGAEKDLGAALAARFPELGGLRDAAGDASLYLVGGAVRDLLLGWPRADVDVVVEGDASAVARALGGEVVEHERFATAKARLEGLEIDLASARAETYAQPGALPDVRPARIEEDLARRDFTVNAMAIPLREAPELIDPHDGRHDLADRLLRVLHERSFADDPTRALRAARYAARFGFELENRTAELLRDADLGTVSADRRRAELLKIAAEHDAASGFELLSRWKLIELPEGSGRLMREVAVLLDHPPWAKVANRERAVLAVALGELGRAPQLADARPSRPSDGVELARGASPEELAVGRALGGHWLDDYINAWRSIVLEIGGSDLIAAGVPEGPAVGRGLEVALRRKLDGEISGGAEELAAALEAALEER